jgi:diguanylate cyclase (GGDEF)-like protein
MSSKTQKSKVRSQPSRDRGRVLLIADNKVDASADLLVSAGLEIVGVSGGAAALVSLQKARPHLVVAQSDLHGVTIKELGRMLAQTGEGLPLLIVGPEAATIDRREEAAAAGAFDYFQLPSERELFVSRATQLVALWQTFERLRAEADLDSLTGLANRRRFRTALQREVERWRRYGVPCALLILDIDYMKQINDQFGHPAGDLVIHQVATVLSQVSRDNDTAARLGGEEFALLLANITGDKATHAAERLRAALADLNISGVGNISVSIGVASCPEHAISERALYSASDAALYVAKNQGRNRVAVAPLVQGKLPGV